MQDVPNFRPGYGPNFASVSELCYPLIHITNGGQVPQASTRHITQEIFYKICLLSVPAPEEMQPLGTINSAATTKKTRPPQDATNNSGEYPSRQWDESRHWCRNSTNSVCIYCCTPCLYEWQPMITIGRI
jgi:hypothetical protein